MNRLSANNTKFYYKNGTAADFTEIEYLMEVPEFGGTPEKIDVTVLSDKTKRYVPGITDLGDLVFKFLYDNSSATANYRVLKGLADAGSDDNLALPVRVPRVDNGVHVVPRAEHPDGVELPDHALVGLFVRP